MLPEPPQSASEDMDENSTYDEISDISWQQKTKLTKYLVTPLPLPDVTNSEGDSEVYEEVQLAELLPTTSPQCDIMEDIYEEHPQGTKLPLASTRTQNNTIVTESDEDMYDYAPNVQHHDPAPTLEVSSVPPTVDDEGIYHDMVPGPIINSQQSPQYPAPDYPAPPPPKAAIPLQSRPLPLVPPSGSWDLPLPGQRPPLRVSKERTSEQLQMETRPLPPTPDTEDVDEKDIDPYDICQEEVGDIQYPSSFTNTLRHEQTSTLPSSMRHRRPERQIFRQRQLSCPQEVLSSEQKLRKTVSHQIVPSSLSQQLSDKGDSDASDTDDPYLPFQLDLDSLDISKLTLEQLEQIDPRHAQLWMLLKMHKMVKKVEDVYESAEQLYGVYQVPQQSLPPKLPPKPSNSTATTGYENATYTMKRPVPKPRKHLVKSGSSDEAATNAVSISINKDITEAAAGHQESSSSQDINKGPVKHYRSRKVFSKLK